MSKKVPNGTIVRTRDEYFDGASSYRKPNYQNKGNYRPTVVIDSNKEDELALLKQTATGTGHITGSCKGYRSKIETKDSKGQPIKESSKFIIKRNKKGEIIETVGKQTANQIKKDSLNHPKDKKRNRTALRNLKKDKQ